MSEILNEISRRKLVQIGRIEDKTRFKKRVNYHPRDFRGVNIRRFFENDEVIFTTVVENDHKVIVKFEGALSELQRRLKQTGKVCTLRDVITSLSVSIDRDNDIKVRCECPDFTYRYAYWATVGEYIFGTGQMERPNYKRTNMDGKGSTCKHLLALLSNKQWLIKLASVINNYIRMNKDLTYDYLYEKPPEDDTDPDQISIFDTQDQDDSDEEVDTAETEEDDTDPEDDSDQTSEEESPENDEDEEVFSNEPNR